MNWCFKCQMRHSSPMTKTIVVDHEHDWVFPVPQVNVVRVIQVCRSCGQKRPRPESNPITGEGL